VPPGGRIAVERGKFELILFYSERRGEEVETDEQLVRAIESGGCTHAIVRVSHYEALRDRSPFREMKLLNTGRLVGAALALLGP
jgi:hypothetical protein